MTEGPGPVHSRPAGPARALASAVLVLEAFVVFFAVLVGKDLSSASDATVWWAGGGAAVACLVVTGLLRFRWAYVLGSLLQLGVIALGALVTAMYFLGVVFLALWLMALALPRLAERRLDERRG